MYNEPFEDEDEETVEVPLIPEADEDPPLVMGIEDEEEDEDDELAGMRILDEDEEEPV